MPNDVIVIKEGENQKTWIEISQSKGSVIGTSSVRRTAQFKAKYPNLEFKDIRGNLNTRLRKLDEPKADEPHYEAIILAAAGIKRLKMGSRISEVIILFLSYDNSFCLFFQKKKKKKRIHVQLIGREE